MSFRVLPKDIKSHILRFVPGETLAKFTVTKEMYALVNKENAFWKEVAKKCHFLTSDPFEPAKVQVLRRIRDLNVEAMKYIPRGHKEGIDKIEDPIAKLELIKKYFFITHQKKVDAIFKTILNDSRYSDKISRLDLVSLFLSNGANTQFSLRDFDSLDLPFYKILLTKLLLNNPKKESILEVELSENMRVRNLINIDTLLTLGARPSTDILKGNIDILANNQVVGKWMFETLFMIQMLCKYLTEDQRKEVMNHIHERRKENTGWLLSCLDLVEPFLKGKTLFSILNFEESNLKEGSDSLEATVAGVIGSITEIWDVAIYIKYCTAADKEKLLAAVNLAYKESSWRPEWKNKLLEFIKNEALQKDFL